jgi:hypothetical protein
VVLSIPAGSSAEFVPPVEHAVVTIDGKCWHGPDGEAGVPVFTGEHEIVVAGRPQVKCAEAYSPSQTKAGNCLTISKPMLW